MCRAGFLAELYAADLQSFVQGRKEPGKDFDILSSLNIRRRIPLCVLLASRHTRLLLGGASLLAKSLDAAGTKLKFSYRNLKVRAARRRDGYKIFWLRPLLHCLLLPYFLTFPFFQVRQPQLLKEK